MNVKLKKMILILMALAWMTGCTKGTVDNSDNIEALKAHMKKHDQTIRITPMVEAITGLVADEAQKQDIIAKANESYTRLGIKNIYLVTGATAETNETVLGSLIHFTKAMTLEEATALLAQDDNFNGQTQGMVVNGHFAYAVSSIGGKTITPKAVLAAFQNFK